MNVLNGDIHVVYHYFCFICEQEKDQGTEENQDEKNKIDDVCHTVRH